MSGLQMPDDLNRDLVMGTMLRDLNNTLLDAWATSAMLDFLGVAHRPPEIFPQTARVRGDQPFFNFRLFRDPVEGDLEQFLHAMAGPVLDQINSLVDDEPDISEDNILGCVLFDELDANAAKENAGLGWAPLTLEEEESESMRERRALATEVTTLIMLRLRKKIMYRVRREHAKWNAARIAALCDEHLAYEFSRARGNGEVQA